MFRKKCTFGTISEIIDAAIIEEVGGQPHPYETLHPLSLSFSILIG